MSIATHLFLFVSMVLLTSCGREGDGGIASLAAVVDPELVEYVRRFERLKGSMEDITVVFAPQEKSIAAVCIVSYEGKRIEVDRDKWSRYSDTIREVVIFHEGGHCLLDRKHDDREIEIEGEVIKRSVMSPKILPQAMYENHRKYYEREL